MAGNSRAPVSPAESRTIIIVDRARACEEGVVRGDRALICGRAVGTVNGLPSAVEHQPDPHRVLQVGTAETRREKRRPDEAVPRQIDFASSLDGRRVPSGQHLHAK